MKYFEFLLIMVVFGLVVGCQKEAVVDQPAGIRQVPVEAAKAEIDAKNAQFIDVRSPEEFGAEHAEKAVNVPLEKVETELVKLDKSRPIYVICQTGRRSQLASETLDKNGFKEVYNVEGGTSAWKKAGLPIEK